VDENDKEELRKIKEYLLEKEQELLMNEPEI